MKVPDFMKTYATTTATTTSIYSVGTQVPSNGGGTVAQGARIPSGSCGRSGETFFALARALWLHDGQDSPLALSLVAYGESVGHPSVKFIADHVHEPAEVRRGLGALFRAAVADCPEQVNFWAAEDPNGYEALIPAIERKPCPEYQAWADAHWKYKLDRHDKAVLAYLDESDAREREAIVAEAPAPGMFAAKE